MSFTQQLRRIWVLEESFSPVVEENTFKVQMENQCYPGGCQEVEIWKLVTLWPLEGSEEGQNIILISDDDDDGEVQCPDDDDEEGENTQGSSVVFVEPQGKSCSLKDFGE